LDASITRSATIPLPAVTCSATLPLPAETRSARHVVRPRLDEVVEGGAWAGGLADVTVSLQGVGGGDLAVGQSALDELSHCVQRSRVGNAAREVANHTDCCTQASRRQIRYAYSLSSKPLGWNSNSDFLAARSGEELSDKIVKVIIKNTRFQYERSLAARSIAIFIALTKSDSNRKSPR
jgi:hypothetical protein